MSTTRTARCRSCGAVIVWATVAASGRTMPVDAEAHDEGTVRFVVDEGIPGPAVQVLAGDVLGRARAERRGVLFRSHFATCPNAGRHRKKRVSPDRWNAQHPIGTRVRYYPIKGHADHVDTVTRSEAWALGDGLLVVAIEGRAGGVHVDHLEVLT